MWRNKYLWIFTHMPLYMTIFMHTCDILVHTATQGCRNDLSQKVDAIVCWEMDLASDVVF